MKILIFSWRGPLHPHSGGAEIVTHEHAKAWVKAGHKVTLFTSNFEGGKKEEIIDGVKVIRQGGQILSVQIQAVIWYLFKEKPKFDLVIDQFHGLPFFTPLFVSTKKIAFIHEVTKEVWKYNTLKEPFHSVVSILGQTLEPLIFKLFYRKIPFLTVSNSTRDELIEVGIPSQNITVIYNGVKGINNLRQQKKDQKIITFIGALAKDKGIEDALYVFSKLKEYFPGFVFWIIGKHDNVYFEYLKKLTKKLEIERNIKYWGYVSEKKKYELLSRSYIIINPSVREGWGLTVIEAGLVGTPTIGYTVAGLRDTIVNGKTGLLTQQNNPDQMADMVWRLIKNKPLYLKLSKNAKKWSNDFSWVKSTKKSLVFVEETVKSLV